MPLPIIPKPIYPLVPKALGVPDVLRSGAQLLDSITLGYLHIGDALNDVIGAEPVKWGVFDSAGKKIAPYDSVSAISYQNDARVSDYPVEGGSFGTYNKVSGPFDIVVALTCGGSEEQRGAFMVALETARRSLDRYTVMTPEHTYYDVNFVSFNWQRSGRDGAYLITAHLGGREIREFAKAEYATPKGVGAYDPKAQGEIQLLNDPTFDASGVV